MCNGGAVDEKYTWVPSTLFNWLSWFSSSVTEEEKGSSLVAKTRSPSPPVTLESIEKRAVQRSTAELVGRESSPRTVLHRERNEREVILEGSPSAEMAGLELQKPLTTALKESSR